MPKKDASFLWQRDTVFWQEATVLFMLFCFINKLYFVFLGKCVGWWSFVVETYSTGKAVLLHNSNSNKGYYNN